MTLAMLTGGDEEAEHGRGQGPLQARRQHRAEGGRHALLLPERRALGVPRKQLRVHLEPARVSGSAATRVQQRWRR